MSGITIQFRPQDGPPMEWSEVFRDDKTGMEAAKAAAKAVNAKALKQKEAMVAKVGKVQE